jgi:proteic killer suppression protein
MIRSFADRATLAILRGLYVKSVDPALQRKARRKLLMIDAAIRITDLLVPPGNRLERLSGDRKEQHSIRVNDQWRICFVWRDGSAHDVELVDYH